MELKIVNRTIATIIILTNIYFVPINYAIIRGTGGSMGYALLMLPVLLTTNFLLITAVLVFKDKYKKSIFLLVINSIGLLWNLFWLWLLLTTPSLD